MDQFFVSSLFLLATIVGTLSYDFHDSYFNHILSTDLLETQDSLDYWKGVEHPRVRRDEEAVGNSDKCRRRRFKECCSTEFMENQHNQDKEYRRECLREIYGKDKDNENPTPDPFKCDKVNKHRKDMTCFMKCTAQKKNLADSDGNLIEKQFRTYVKDNLKESWLESSIDDIATKCLSEARNATSNQTKADTDSCNPASIKSSHCLYREIQLRCPEDLIKDQKSCSKFKDRVKKNEEFTGNQEEIES